MRPIINRQPYEPMQARIQGLHDNHSHPDFNGARHYACTRLARELAPSLTYHSIAHTRDDVVPAVERLAAMEGVSGEDLLLLRTAAYYHDLGFVTQRVGHEEIGAAIAAAILPTFGYTSRQIDVIQGIIRATQLPQSPRNILEAIMADADLDVLGRDDFFARNQALRNELAAYGTITTDTQWYRGQLQFLESHRYFTAAATTLRAAKKQTHIEQVRALVALCALEDEQG